MDLFRRQLAFFQILLHEPFVILGDHLDEFVSFFGSLRPERRRDILLPELPALVLLKKEGLHPHEVHDAAKIPLLPDWELGGNGAAAEELDDRFKRPLEIGVLPVELIDDDQPRQLILFEHLPDFLGADLDSGDPIDQDGRAIHRPQGGFSVPEEIAVAGGIDAVDLVLVGFKEADGRVDRDLAVDLFRLVVGDSVPFVDFGQPAGRPEIEQEGGGQGCLSRGTMADQGDVSDLVRSIIFHHEASQGLVKKALARFSGSTRREKRAGDILH